MEEEKIQSPLVSIIAVCYNHARFVEETLDSILAQTYPNIELIIMDDCSKDESVEVIQHWIERNQVECIFIPHETNQGLCTTLNEAVDYCNGKYLSIISCDDIMMPKKIESQLRYFVPKKDNIGVVFSDSYVIQEDGTQNYGTIIPSSWRFIKIPEGNIFEALLDGNFIPALTCLILREAVLEVNKYDESLPFEDYDMWLRLSKKYEFKFDHYISTKYRVHNNNYHKKIDLLTQKYWVLQKHADIKKGRKVLTSLILKIYIKKGPRAPEVKHFLSKHNGFNNKKVISFFIKANIPFIWYHLFTKVSVNLLKLFNLK